jgi:hypothetical protein
MENLPLYIPLVFGLTTLLAVAVFYKATQYSSSFLLLLLVWTGLQAILGLTGFYRVFSSFPPRFPLLLVPPIVLIVVLFTTQRGKMFIDSLDLGTLTLFSIVRIPVEIVLFWLFVQKAIPELMTFEGRNFDILAGLSAPFLYYFVFVKRTWSKTVLLVWNFSCLALLTNIVVNAILSAPSPFQQFAFDQPNIGVLYFPFVWLPSCIVPLVFFSHFVSIRRLVNGKAIA